MFKASPGFQMSSLRTIDLAVADHSCVFILGWCTGVIPPFLQSSGSSQVVPVGLRAARARGGGGRWVQHGGCSLTSPSNLPSFVNHSCCLVCANLDKRFQQIIINSSKAKWTMVSLKRMFSLNYLGTTLSGMQQRRTHDRAGLCAWGCAIN